jgi:hypothetical protein
MGLLFDVTNGEVDDSFAFWLIYLDTLTYVDFISSTIQHTARTDKNRPVSCRDIQSTRHTASVHASVVPFVFLKEIPLFFLKVFS